MVENKRGRKLPERGDIIGKIRVRPETIVARGKMSADHQKPVQNASSVVTRGEFPDPQTLHRSALEAEHFLAEQCATRLKAPETSWIPGSAK